MRRNLLLGSVGRIGQRLYRRCATDEVCQTQLWGRCLDHDSERGTFANARGFVPTGASLVVERLIFHSLHVIDVGRHHGVRVGTVRRRRDRKRGE